MQEISTLTADSILDRDVFMKTLAIQDDYEKIRTFQKLEAQAKACGVKKQFTDLYKVCESQFKNNQKAAIQAVKQEPAPSQSKTVNLKRDEETGKVIQSIDNVCEALRKDRQLSGKIRYNMLSYSPFVYGELPWSKDTYREWNNTDDSNLKCYIESKYGLKSLEKIMEGLNIVVAENRFNPVVEYLEQLIWDGNPHIENLLPNYLGVKKDRYSTESMKLFMLGAINRAYHPGCKFDYMPVLVGGQGIGKSTFLKILAGNDDWYNDNFNTVDGDKAVEKLRGMWIVELAELLAVKKTQEVESMKAFITSTVDTYRPPYGRRTEQRPRVCVFAGTTNNMHFLTDRTGNRRYLPLLADGSKSKLSMFENTEEVRKDFQQAWAEALYIFKADKPKLVLPKDLEQSVKQQQESYLEEDVRVGIIQEWLDLCKEDHVCVAMIYSGALENESKKPNRRESNEIHDIMRTSINGWKLADTDSNKRAIKGFGTQICYDRVKEESPANDGFVSVAGLDPDDLPFT